MWLPGGWGGCPIHLQCIGENGLLAAAGFYVVLCLIWVCDVVCPIEVTDSHCLMSFLL